MDVLGGTSSTNDVAREAAETGAPDGHVVVADHQSNGRGQHNRSWSSAPGEDLCFSIADRPRLDERSLPILTLAVGLGVADTVDEWLAAPERSLIKWPNDVWINRRKCAGILVEVAGPANRMGPVVIGIGLNVNRVSWPEELGSKVTSIFLNRPAEGRIDRARVLAQTLFHVEEWVERLVRDGPPPVVEALNQRLALRGKEVRCGSVQGSVVEVAPDGALRLATPDGHRDVVSGSLVPVG